MGEQLMTVPNGTTLQELSKIASYTALNIPEGTTQEGARQLMCALAVQRTANYWHWIDLAVYAERWGDIADDAAAMCGWTSERFRQILSRGKQFSREERIPGLKFSAYEAVCCDGLDHDERMVLLEKVWRLGLSVARTRALVDEYLAIKGIERHRRRTDLMTAGQIIMGGDDPAVIIAEQAQTIRDLSGHVDRLTSVVGHSSAVVVSPDNLPETEQVADDVVSASTVRSIASTIMGSNLPENIPAAELVASLCAMAKQHAGAAISLEARLDQTGARALEMEQKAAEYEGRYVRLRDNREGRDEDGNFYIRVNTPDLPYLVAVTTHFQRLTRSKWTPGGAIGRALEEYCKANDIPVKKDAQ